MPLLRRAAIWLIAAFTMWILCCGAIGVMAVESALHPIRNRLTTEARAAAEEVAARNNASLEEVEIRAADNTALRAWYLHPDTNTDTSANTDVILLHGVSDNRAGMLGNANLLLRHGYAVLLPDSRDHGDSDGPIATYGVLESDDLHRWFNWLQQRDHPHCIDGIGDSMGAAQLLESLTVNSYCAVVAESPFSTFREAGYDRIGQQLGTGPWLGRSILRPAVEFGLLYARFRYDVNLAQASPLHAVERTHTPVLLIHGQTDTNLPPRHSEALAKSNPAIQLWEPAATEHTAAYSTHPAEYEHRVLDWLAWHNHP
jgi:pimeloyl-ACP methyl ester carboxylesterase